MDQISMHDPYISEAQVRQALTRSGLGGLADSLPQGLQTPVQQLTNLSAGQRQLLAIARAIVLDPPILFLDEITANLDSQTEAHCLSVLRAAGKGRLILSVSHRPASLLQSDRIILLEDGRIVSQGDPQTMQKEAPALFHHDSLCDSAFCRAST